MTHLTHRTHSLRVAFSLMLILLLSLAAFPAQSFAAGEVFDGTPGTGAPPATLGPYTMLPFGDDARPLLEDVTTVPGPTGDLLFSRPASHRTIGSGWGTWSHGYTGDVYYFDTMQPTASQPMAWDTVEITLPANTMAFYLYVEPNGFDDYETVVSAGGATSGPVMVTGDSGAMYFGFYGTTSPLTTVTVAMDVAAGGFAIGEFGIFAGEPEPGAPVAPVTVRADVSAVIFGGWGGMPVQAFVGGTAQPMRYTAPNHEGHAAVLYSFWPPAGSAWRVALAPELPAGLDPAQWEIRLVSIRRGTTWDNAPTSGEVTITRGSQVTLYYQLVNTDN